MTTTLIIIAILAIASDLGLTALLTRMAIVRTRLMASSDMRSCVIHFIQQRERASDGPVQWTRHEKELLDALYDFQVKYDNDTEAATPAWILKLEDMAKDFKARAQKWRAPKETK